MKCKFILLFILLSGCLLVSKAQEYDFQQQINEQVWQPYIKAYNTLDTDGFMAVHSKKMTRVMQDDNRVLNYREYYQNNRQGNENARKYFEQYKASRTIEVRFIQRIAGRDKAFESGYYKVTNTLEDGKTQCFYGKFEVLLRRENKIWKILMDADAFDDTDESVFQTGKALNK